jgi:hypothetical protein
LDASIEVISKNIESLSAVEMRVFGLRKLTGMSLELEFEGFLNLTGIRDS